MSIRVLVTGAGSVVGQGIIKSLRQSDISIVVIATDMSPLSAALYRADESILLPKVEDNDSLTKIIEQINKLSIDLILIGSEYDIEFYALHTDRIKEDTGANVVSCPYNTIQLSNDKYLTAEFLKKNNLPYSPAIAPTSLDEAISGAEKLGYPLILKPRAGTSSRNIHFIKNEEQLITFYSQVNKPMIQNIIEPISNGFSNEYTCSIFGTNENKILGPFIARRTLRGGSSWVVEVCDNAEIEALIIRISKFITIKGAFNIQLILSADGPIPFEFNARFSGTTSIRSHFGFNEPIMSVLNFVQGKEISAPKISHGVALRYEEEVFLDGVCVEDLKMPLQHGEIIRCM